MRDYSTGICNCRYYVRGTAIAIKTMPGAIKLSFKPSASDRSMLVRYSDGRFGQYSTARKTQEKRAELEIVSLPDNFLTDVLGWTKITSGSDSGAYIEGIKPDIHISLLYETNNGNRPVRYWIYDCVIAEPNFDATTINDSLGVDTRKLELIINPDPENGNNYSKKIARADNSTLYDTWFGLITT